MAKSILRASARRPRQPTPSPSKPVPVRPPQLEQLLEHIQTQQRQCGRLSCLLHVTRQEASAEDIGLIEIAEELADGIHDQLHSVVIGRLIGEVQS